MILILHLKKLIFILLEIEIIFGSKIIIIIKQELTGKDWIHTKISNLMIKDGEGSRKGMGKMASEREAKRVVLTDLFFFFCVCAFFGD